MRWTKQSSDYNRSGKHMGGSHKRAKTKKWFKKLAHKCDRLANKKVVRDDIIYFRG